MGTVSYPLSGRFQSFSRACAVLTGGVAAVVLLGWLLDIRVLKSLHPSWGTMKANTALAFLLSAISLRLEQAQPPGKEGGRFSRVCAAGVAGIGLLTLAEYSSGRKLGIDQILFREATGAACLVLRRGQT